MSFRGHSPSPSDICVVIGYFNEYFDIYWGNLILHKLTLLTHLNLYHSCQISSTLSLWSGLRYIFIQQSSLVNDKSTLWMTECLCIVSHIWFAYILLRKLIIIWLCMEMGSIHPKRLQNLFCDIFWTVLLLWLNMWYRIDHLLSKLLIWCAAYQIMILFNFLFFFCFFFQLLEEGMVFKLFKIFILIV